MLTETREFFWLVSPLPSRPYSPNPQHFNAPPESTPQVCLPPTETEAAELKPAEEAATQTIDEGQGAEEEAVS